MPEKRADAGSGRGVSAGWLKRLARPGRVLAPLPGGRTGFGVYAGADRRRRPFATVSRTRVEQAVSDGLIEPAGQGAYVLAEAGLARLRRAEAPAGEGFAAQHRRMGRREVIDEAGRLNAVRADLDSVSPVARYARAQGDVPPLLDPVHVTAAETLARDYERSALRSRVTSDWTAPPQAKTRGAPRDPADLPASRLDARARVMDALAAAGPGLDRLLVDVVLRETGMSAAERDLGWPARAGAPALRLALERVAVHYRLKAPAKTADPFS
ncbi:hypothetical protein DDZ18_09895 [Marinicauda salina]|uniref:DUF6456 domain-containing protein n=1 Tax=Marinicauda salina TaxID=2135793 RepID=A0A2U2BSN5_9PROT|nr:DUF6456 domain-containing protein [Marinicauda salina]PWE17007.1 hypothetical protein DDZ18_09895 [Marinicauda salina]